MSFNQDQARRWAEEVDLPEPDGTAEANMQPHPEGGYTYDEVPAWSETIVREAIAASLVKLTQGQESVAWRDYVEQRLLNWKQRKMNRSGDRLALDDFMDKVSLDDLIDYVCSEYEGPAPIQQEDRKPLTEPQIANAWMSVTDPMALIFKNKQHVLDFARAIEAAHNIKEQQ